MRSQSSKASMANENTIALLVAARDAGGRRTDREQYVGRLALMERLRRSGPSIAEMWRCTALVKQGRATLTRRREMLAAHRAKLDWRDVPTRAQPNRYAGSILEGGQTAEQRWNGPPMNRSCGAWVSGVKSDSQVPSCGAAIGASALRRRLADVIAYAGCTVRSTASIRNASQCASASGVSSCSPRKAESVNRFDR